MLVRTHTQTKRMHQQLVQRGSLHVVVIKEFSDTGVVKIFDSLQMTNVVIGNEVDGVTLAAKTTTSADSANRE